jgi:hypothetical protein
MDAVLADADGSVVTASDIGLARALGLFRLAPSAEPIGAGDVERYLDALLLLQETDRLRIETTAVAREAAWREAADRLGGADALVRWLHTAGIDEAWARRQVERDLLMRRLVAIRFQAFVFVSEAQLAEALGPGRHPPAERERRRADLAREAAERAVAAWLADQRFQAQLRLVPLPPEGIPVPLLMPGPAAGRP